MMKRTLAQQKALIKACVESGTEIVYMPEAPRFRFTPVEDKPQYNGKPTARGTYGYKKRFKSRWWSPQSLDLKPQYNVAMKGDDPQLTEARRAWHNGQPEQLRRLIKERKYD